MLNFLATILGAFMGRKLKIPKPPRPAPPRLPTHLTSGPSVGMNYPEAFVWWQQSMHGGKFPFQCCGPDCGLTIPLKNRVSQSSRRCPGCGTKITLEAIDDQLLEWERDRRKQIKEMNAGCLGLVLVVSVAVGIWFF